MLSTAYPRTYPLWITFNSIYNCLVNTNTLTNSSLIANSNLETFWVFVADSFSKELSPQQFKTWIKPLFPFSFDQENLTLSLAAPNRFKLDWAKNQFNQSNRILDKIFFKFFNRFEVFKNLRICESVVLLNLDTKWKEIALKC